MCPAIVDVLQLIELLEKMGVKVGHPAEDTYTFEAREIDFGYLQSEDYRKRAARLRRIGDDYRAAAGTVRRRVYSQTGR